MHGSGDLHDSPEEGMVVDLLPVIHIVKEQLGVQMEEELGD